jgi:hypothetical protein
MLTQISMFRRNFLVHQNAAMLKPATYLPLLAMFLRKLIRGSVNGFVMGFNGKWLTLTGWSHASVLLASAPRKWLTLTESG